MSARYIAGLLCCAAFAVAFLGGCKTAPEPEPEVAQQSPVENAADPGWEVRYVDTSLDVELHEPFVKLVDLAKLRVGMTKQEVLAIFPDPFSIELRGTDEMWQYGFAELLFRGNFLRDWFNIR